jgi:hypothetical protein
MPVCVPQYTIADEAGNIPLGEDSFGNRLRSVELPDRAGSYFDKNYEAVGPGPVRPGLEPGDLRAKNRLFEAAPQRQFDKVNALNEANRIDAAVAQLERNADYDVTDEIPPRANLLASSRQDTAPSLRTRNITNPQHSRDFAAKLRNERDLGLLNKKAAQRAGRNIPGMSGAELAEIPTRKALSSLEYPERLDAIHELDRQAQANITRELNSPSFRKRVDELADPGGRLRAAAGGRASVAAELGRLRQDAAEEIRLDIIGKHKSVVPAGLRDATVDEYRAGLESTRKANVEKRRNYVEARIDAYTGGDAALNRKVGRSARMYGFFDAAGDNPLPASVIEENVSSIYAADKAIDVFQNITGKTVSTNKRRKAFAEGGYRQVVNLLYTMAGEGGDFYFRDPSIGGLKIFNKADRGAWFDQFISGISGGLFGDVSDDTIIFENRTTGKRITAGDLHGGDPVVKDMFQDFIDATYQRE